MAKEFLQKHFINEAKAAINRWSGSGGTAPDPVIQPLNVTENGIYTAPDGVDGYSPISVEIASTGGTDDRLKQLILRKITEVSDDTVTYIGSYAFYNCGNLTIVNTPSVNSIGSYAFYNCTSLKSIDFSLAKSVGECGFYNCTSLTGVNLPLAENINKQAFSRCSALESIDLPLATSITTSAFEHCLTLKRANFPCATNISAYAFQNCIRLEKLDFALLTNITYLAFDGASRFKTLIIRSDTLCTLGNSSAFNGTPFASGKAGGTLLVPRALVESYKTATNWSIIWGYGHNRFLALEDYTLDGTITGEIDWDKLNGGAA